MNLKILGLTLLFGLLISYSLLSEVNPRMVEIRFDDQDKEILVFDVFNKKNNLPKNFRTPKKLSSEFIKNSTLRKYGFSIDGFNELKISGSGQFSEKEFIKTISKIKKLNQGHDVPIYFIDLRKESHFYLNGNAVSLYSYHNGSNEELTTEEIEEKELRTIAELKQVENVNIFHIEKSINKGESLIGTNELVLVQNIKSEREMVEEQGFIYKRIPLQDHLPPTTNEEEKIRSFLNEIPANSWIHFHCRAGKGRTTTLMMITDILKNKRLNTVSLDHFIRRHAALGGSDFFRIQSLQKNYIYDMVINRLNFIRDFYQKS